MFKFLLRDNTLNLSIMWETGKKKGRILRFDHVKLNLMHALKLSSNNASEMEGFVVYEIHYGSRKAHLLNDLFHV